MKCVYIKWKLKTHFFLKIFWSLYKIFYCATYILKKEMSHSIKKVFLFSTRFSNFQDTYHFLYYPQMSVFSFHTFAALLHQFLRHRAYKEYLSFSVNPGGKSSTKWMKKSLGYHGVSTEYVTGQLIFFLCCSLWNNFTVWFLHCLENLCKIRIAFCQPRSRGCLTWRETVLGLKLVYSFINFVIHLPETLYLRFLR